MGHIHAELWHIFSKEIRESPHISREWIDAILCCRVVCRRWLFMEIYGDFLGALNRDGHKVAQLSIRNTRTCRQTVLDVECESWHIFMSISFRFYVHLAVSAGLLWVDAAELPVSGKVTWGEETPGRAHCTLPPSHQLTDLQLVNITQEIKQYIYSVNRGVTNLKEMFV